MQPIQKNLDLIGAAAGFALTLPAAFASSTAANAVALTLFSEAGFFLSYNAVLLSALNRFLKMQNIGDNSRKRILAATIIVNLFITIVIMSSKVAISLPLTFTSIAAVNLTFMLFIKTYELLNRAAYRKTQHTFEGSV